MHKCENQRINIIANYQMRKKHIFKLFGISFLIIISLVSCDKNENKLDVQIDKVVINDYGEFPFQDSLTFLVKDNLQYEIKIETNPRNADIYYSKNTNDFTKISGEWISIDSTFNKLRFYANGDGFIKTKISELNIGFGKDSIISNVTLYPNPCNDILYYEFESEYIRGGYYYNINNLAGKRLLAQNDFISENEIHNSINLDTVPSGVYFVLFEFGNTILASKIIKR